MPDVCTSGKTQPANQLIKYTIDDHTGYTTKLNIQNAYLTDKDRHLNMICPPLSASSFHYHSSGPTSLGSDRTQLGWQEFSNLYSRDPVPPGDLDTVSRGPHSVL